MATAFAPAVQRLLEYFMDKAAPEEVLAYQLTDEEIAYARDLLDRASNEGLEPDEQMVLEQMRYVDRVVSLLKARALDQLDAG